METNAEFDKVFAESLTETSPPQGREDEAGAETPPEQSGETSNPTDDAGQETQPAATEPEAATAEGEKPEAQKPDIWANATPEQRSAYEAERKAREAAEQAYRSNEGRWRTAQNIIASNAAKRAAKKPLEKDSFKKLEADYPEVAEPVREIISDLMSGDEELHTELSADLTQNDLLANQNVLAQAHPDWMDVSKNEGFWAWANEQPQYVKDVLAKNSQAITDPQAVADVMTRFKTTAQPQANQAQSDLKAKRDAQLSASSGLPNRGPGRGATPPNEFNEAFAYALSEEKRR